MYAGSPPTAARDKIHSFIRDYDSPGFIPDLSGYDMLPLCMVKHLVRLCTSTFEDEVRDGEAKVAKLLEFGRLEGVKQQDTSLPAAGKKRSCEDATASQEGDSELLLLCDKPASYLQHLTLNPSMVVDANADGLLASSSASAGRNGWRCEASQI